MQIALVSEGNIRRYDDSGVNWRVVEAYGRVIAAHGAGLPVMLGQAVRLIDRSGRRLRGETAAGAITAGIALRTRSRRPAAPEEPPFRPPLPRKNRTAQGPPPGTARKIFPSLASAGRY